MATPRARTQAKADTSRFMRLLWGKAQDASAGEWARRGGRARALRVGKVARRARAPRGSRRRRRPRCRGAGRSVLRARARDPRAERVATDDRLATTRPKVGRLSFAETGRSTLPR